MCIFDSALFEIRLSFGMAYERFGNLRISTQFGWNLQDLPNEIGFLGLTNFMLFIYIHESFII